MNRYSPDDSYTRRDSLRLRGFDYTSRGLYFITIVATKRRRFFLYSSLADSTVQCVRDLRVKMEFRLTLTA